MNADFALRLLADLFWVGFVICAPLLGVVMLVGVLISVAQVVTQVQEMSLTFVPKLVAAGVVLIVGGPWMLRKLVQFTSQLWLSLPSMF